MIDMVLLQRMVTMQIDESRGQLVFLCAAVGAFFIGAITAQYTLSVCNRQYLFTSCRKGGRGRLMTT